MTKQRRRMPTQTDKETFEARVRQRTEATRMMNGLLLFWRMCGNKQCLRQKACAGDADACASHHWRIMPEPEKTWIRTGLLARGRGLSAAEAAKAADAEVKRCEELDAKLDAMGWGKAKMHDGPLPSPLVGEGARVEAKPSEGG
jgi:hypothetical protein